MPDSDHSPLLVQPTPSIELIFLGTGTSGSLPNVSCLTAPEGASPCKTCLSTLRPEGKKNIRRNTSAVMRIGGKDGKKRFVFPLQRLMRASARAVPQDYRYRRRQELPGSRC